MNKVQVEYITELLYQKIEKGRFENIELEQRLCIFCERNEIENEVHFLINCDLYKDRRTILFSKTIDECNHVSSLNDQEKFIHLMTKCQYYVAQYTENAWNMTKDKLYNSKL